MKQRPWSRLLLLLAAFALVLASCASSDSDGASSDGGGDGGGDAAAATCQGKAGVADTAEPVGKAGDAESFKTRKGKIGGYAEYLSPEDVEWLNRRIDTELDPYFGYSSAPLPGPVRD